VRLIKSGCVVAGFASRIETSFLIVEMIARGRVGGSDWQGRGTEMRAFHFLVHEERFAPIVVGAGGEFPTVDSVQNKLTGRSGLDELPVLS